ncbi:MAG: STAS domain-containing protein [Bacteroidales bacterium]|nr:STAS domain-containing protein [Bacteroidales bacterium]MBS3773705.1 STAS domain-containing protein [Bacteroidales bacterium]
MLKSEKRNGVEILSFENVSKLNILVAQTLKEEMAQYLNSSGKNLVLNMEGIEYVDSSGFGALLSILRNAKNNNSTFKICNVSPDVMELVKLLQLHNVFEIYDSVEECVQSFQ